MSENGMCKIKAEFLVVEHKRELELECVSEKDKRKLNLEDGSGSPEKKARLSSAEKKKLRGQNKSRGPTFRCERDKELCNTLIDVLEGETAKECIRKKCTFLHDVQEYLKMKPKDLGDICINFNRSGKCNRGLACRYGSAHITPDGKNMVNPDKVKEFEAIGPRTTNALSYELQISLRKRTYDFKLAEGLVQYNDRLRKERDLLKQNKKSDNSAEIKTIESSNGEDLTKLNIKEETKNVQTTGTVTDEDIIKLLKREKKTIDFKNKLFLSPLTTVGNLPFRRICKEFGADITCGEMAMCSSLLQGLPQEWALVRRHHTEDIFGVQLCANNPYLLTKCGQMLEKEADIDFIDLNLGCPIEMVYKEGGGCGLLRRTRVLEHCVKNLSEILTIPMTCKTRMGVYTNDNIAHNLVPKFRDWGASLVTIHGRSREQRYTRNADWNYINKCAEAASPMPLIGNGDILTYDDYKTALEMCPDLSGVMIGRGALIKPWIFTEIKEQKLWDITSSERFDILKKYTGYCLEHWGSDNKGVENTRRFMLEWLSFLHRYIPVGLLETPPQKINERPPCFRGRDDLETLMISTSASDWVKISEMLLGPVPDNFHFLPKHKANSYK